LYRFPISSVSFPSLLCLFHLFIFCLHICFPVVSSVPTSSLSQCRHRTWLCQWSPHDFCTRHCSRASFICQVCEVLVALCAALATWTFGVPTLLSTMTPVWYSLLRVGNDVPFGRQLKKKRRRVRMRYKEELYESWTPRDSSPMACECCVFIGKPSSRCSML
jgi:hypothetical protein